MKHDTPGHCRIKNDVFHQHTVGSQQLEASHYQALLRRLTLSINPHNAPENVKWQGKAVTKAAVMRHPVSSGCSQVRLLVSEQEH